MPRHGDKCVVKSCAAVVPFLHMKKLRQRERGYRTAQSDPPRRQQS